MQDAFGYCQTLVRAADRDRFLAVLFAPSEHRDALFAIYAFNVEVARVRELVRDPLSGEIRLQWWSDVLGGGGHGEVEANPVVSALRASVARYGLPSPLLAALVAARRFDLYDDPMATLADLESYASAVSSGLIAIAAQILRGGRLPDIETAAQHAGIAYAIAGLLKAFPVHAARGQLFVPLEILERYGTDRTDIARRPAKPDLRMALADLRGRARRHLAQARDLMKAVPPDLVPALLPVALAGPTLDRMERRDYDPFVPVEIAPWRRQWLIWRAARQPQRILG